MNKALKQPRPMKITLLIAALFLSPLRAQDASPNSKAGEFFETRVRPVLANNCYTCHTDLHSGGLRLDSRQAVLQGGNRGPAIVAGDPGHSLLIQAISHTHANLKMPPGKKLAVADIEALEIWVRSGAIWPEAPAAVENRKTAERAITPEQRAFWSFQPLRNPAPPFVSDKLWTRSPVDSFILAKLEAARMKPVLQSSRRQLIRRATYDLTGLPPTPAETDDFLRDSSVEAFSKVVDRLLASPHFGERWGRYWLDVARFAEDDVRGLSQESYPNAWRYRDWVIEAMNRDLPYDQFVRAQVAGDLLGDKDLAGGLGFFGLGPWYYDITVPAQARADERHDRVDALTRGFLGLTVACARCHDHKFDPISMQDYYAIAGVFASSEYHEYPLVPANVSGEYDRFWTDVQRQEAAITQYTNNQSAMLAELLAAKTEKYILAAWKVAGPAKLAVDKAGEADGLDRETLERWVVYLTKAEREHSYLKGWDHLITRKDCPSLEQERLEVSRFGHELEDNIVAILREKKEIDEDNGFALRSHKTKGASITRLPNGFNTYEEFCPGCEVEVKALERDKYMLWNDLFGSGGNGDGNEKGKKVAVLVYAGDKLDRWLSGQWKSHLDDLRAELGRRKKLLPAQYPYLHGLADSSHPANLRVHLRGSPYSLGDEAPRRFLAVLSSGDPTPFHGGSGRLELANAIASHPLTARVITNRVWEHLFGAGLVATPSNFGKMGQPPTHPELLEYLSSSLVANHWSMKFLIRKIMLSSTYQLSSEYSQQNYARDPDNRLHWRVSRRRLDVEALRDSVLFAAGSLNPGIGGASVDLKQDTTRRTIYGKVSRFKLDEMLALFDFPSPAITSEKRNVTSVPLQRLYYMNGDLVWSQAAALANKIVAYPSLDTTARIQKLYAVLFARPATAAEVRLGVKFVGQTETNWQDYVQALFSSNEFSFID